MSVTSLSGPPYRESCSRCVNLSKELENLKGKRKLKYVRRMIYIPKVSFTQFLVYAATLFAVGGLAYHWLQYGTDPMTLRYVPVAIIMILLWIHVFVEKVEVE